MPSFADPSSYELLTSCEGRRRVRPITHRPGALQTRSRASFLYCPRPKVLYNPRHHLFSNGHQGSGQERDYIDGLVEWPK